MIPADFAPAEGFPEVRRILDALHEALAKTRPERIVCLSSVGAQRDRGLGLITQLHLLEESLRPLNLPTAAVRPAWFMENAAWDIAPARERGEIRSFLRPLDRAIPMVATPDIGRVMADLLEGPAWSDWRSVELEGPRSYAPNEVAASLSKALGRSVKAVEVQRQEWEQVLGPNANRYHIEMLDGFNSGWITFEGQGAEHRCGKITLDDTIQKLVAAG